MMGRSLKQLRFLLNAREKIAGISFSDRAIYCALRSNSLSLSPAITTELPLPQNTIVDGIVLDHEVLARELTKALRNLRSPVAFANLSLPSALIFSTILHLPRSKYPASNYADAIDLLLDVELPWKRDAAYTSYSINEGKVDLVVSIFSVLRASADPYILAAEQAGLEVLALECDAQSIIRLTKTNISNVLIVTATETHVNICITKNNAIRFLFSLPTEKIQDEASLKRELVRIQNYFTSETGEVLADNSAQITLHDDARLFLGNNARNVSIYPAAGAALRDPAPAQQTQEISLLPLRSDELFNLHRIASGAQLLRQAIIVTCVILLGAHVLLIQVLNNVAKQSTERATNAPHLYANVAELDKESTELSQALGAAENIRARTQRYASILEIIDGIATEGIMINSITTTGGIGAPITISGIAATRNQYNFFRTSIATTNRLDILSFPLGNLDISVNIPFSLSAKINNP